MQDVFLVVNFGDRAHASGATVEAFDAVLRERGARYRIEASRSIPHCHELIQEAWREGFRTVVVGGGDGTVNVVLNDALAPQLTLGVLPLGTVNALARSLGLDSRQPVEALRNILRSDPVPVAVGRVDQRRFICFASVGFDAVVAHRARGLLKRALGRGAFGIVGLKEAVLVRRLPRFAYRIDEGPVSRANLLVLSNIPRYAGATLFSTEVQAQSFQGFACEARSPFELIRLAWNAAKGPPVEWTRRVPAVHLYPDFRRVRIQSTRPLTAQIDGEPFDLADPRRVEFVVESSPQPFLIPRRDANSP